MSSRGSITFDRWLVLVINQTESRTLTNPEQPLDITKDTRRFIVISNKDTRNVFNCVECVSKKTQVNYPDVEIVANPPLFTMDTIVRVGMIYTLLKKTNGITVIGSLSDSNIRNKIIIGIRHYLPTELHKTRP